MKYYRVIKENFLWDINAILEEKKSLGSHGGYKPVDEVFIKHEEQNDEYISSLIVENDSEYFERVYKVNLATRIVYDIKDRVKELLEKDYKN